jgi:PAS domain S-box-containing protein
MYQGTQGVSADLAQRRVRWLSIAGVGSGGLLFAIATALLIWTNSIREHVNQVEHSLLDARVSVGRVLIDLHSDWDNLLTDSVQENSAEEVTPLPTWKWQIESVAKRCDQLNKGSLLKSIGATVSVSIEPLLRFHEQAIAWNVSHRSLVAASQEKLSLTDDLLQDLLQELDAQDGQTRLRLAIKLRAQEGHEHANTKELFADCARNALSSRLRSDLTDLRLKLFQLVAAQDSDELININENQIRPLLRRLRAGFEDYGLKDGLDEVELAIFHPRQSPDPASIPHIGLAALRLALADSNMQRKLLNNEAANAIAKLAGERSHMATVSSELQDAVNSKFSRVLIILWGVVLAVGLGLSLVFLMLTRRVSRDISLQVEAVGRSAAELAQEKLLLATVISSLPNPLFWKDKQGRYLGCSQSFAEWLGLKSASEVIGKTDTELPWHLDTAAQKEAFESEVIATAQPFNAEMSKTMRDGRKSIVLASTAPLYSTAGKVDGVLGAYIDITERKTMEERASGLAKVMAECPSEIYVFDVTELRLVELNRSACRSSGFKGDLYRHSTFSEINQLLCANALKAVLEPLLDGSKEQVGYETLHRRCDGTAYPVHVSVLSTELGGQQVFVACATDLTEYKQLESKLAHAQKLESIGQLAAGIAHEINTPMQCISGNIEFLQNSSGKLMDVVDALQAQLHSPPAVWEQRAQTLHQLMVKNRYDFLRNQVPLAINESSQAASKVIEIVRAMKVMSHPGTREKVTTDLNALIRDAATVSRHRWKDAADIEFNLNPKLPPIEALPAELSQVFLNLLVNAADAIVEKHGNGQGTLGRISICSSHDEKNVYISIHDNGAGMSEATKSKVFEPFFTTKDVGKGTGQGLSIAYNVIAKLHNGSIDIDSKLGIGTTFTLSMPRENNSSLCPPLLLNMTTTPASTTINAT